MCIINWKQVYPFRPLRTFSNTSAVWSCQVSRRWGDRVDRGCGDIIESTGNSAYIHDIMWGVPHAGVFSFSRSKKQNKKKQDRSHFTFQGNWQYIKKSLSVTLSKDTEKLEWQHFFYCKELGIKIFPLHHQPILAKI